MSLRRQLEALQTVSFLSAAGKVVPFHRRKSTGNPAGRKYAWEMARGSFQWASPIHNAEMIKSKRWTWLLPQAAPARTRLALCMVSMSSSGSLPCSALPAPSHAQVWEGKAISYTGGIVLSARASALHVALSSYTEESPARRSQGKNRTPSLGFMSHPWETSALPCYCSPHPACLPQKLWSSDIPPPKTRDGSAARKLMLPGKNR